MDKFIIVFVDGNVEEVTCEFITQTGGIIRFCNHRKSLLDQRLKGSEIVFSVNESAIRYFKKVSA